MKRATRSDIDERMQKDGLAIAWSLKRDIIPIQRTTQPLPRSGRPSGATYFNPMQLAK